MATSLWNGDLDEISWLSHMHLVDRNRRDIRATGRSAEEFYGD
jgi:hypothetical protein